VPISLKR
jgi:hypothetical protein